MVKIEMTFKRKKPKSSSTLGWTHSIAPKRLQEEHFGKLLNNGLDDSRVGEQGSGEKRSDDISLEEYAKKRENELIKYNLSCSCSNIAGYAATNAGYAATNDQGAMHFAHIMLTLDFLESMDDWRKREETERKMAERFHAQTSRGGKAVVDFIRWEKAKSDRAFFGKMFNEASRELQAFETDNRGLFCSMTVGQTSDEKQNWRNLKLIHL